MADDWVPVGQQEQEDWVPVQPPEQEDWVPVAPAAPAEPSLMDKAGGFLQQNIVQPVTEAFSSEPRPVTPVGETHPGVEKLKETAGQIVAPLGEAAKAVSSKAVEAIHNLEKKIYSSVGLEGGPTDVDVARGIIDLLKTPGKVLTGEIPLTRTNPETGEEEFTDEAIGKATELSFFMLGRTPAMRGAPEVPVARELTPGVMKGVERFREFEAARERLKVPGRLIEGEVGAPPKTAAEVKSPFPNAATDDLSGLDLSGVEFAPEPPAPGTVVPGLPPRPAFNRPGGPGEVTKPSFGKIPSREFSGYQIDVELLAKEVKERFPVINRLEFDEKFKKELDELRGTYPDLSPANISNDVWTAIMAPTTTAPPMMEVPKGMKSTSEGAEDIIASNPAAYVEGLRIQRDQAARDGDNSTASKINAEILRVRKQYKIGRRDQTSQAAKLRADLEDLKARQANMTDREKFEMALAEQEARNAEAAKQKQRKPKFTVIPGGKPPPEKPPGLQSTEILEPDPDAVQPLPPDPEPVIEGLPEPFSSIERRPGTPMAVVPKGVEFGGMKAIRFGTPADIERWIPQIGERNMDLVAGRKEDFSERDVTAVTEDLPTGAGEAWRVTGGTIKSRSHLRAAIDLVKVSKQRKLLADFAGAASALKEAETHYRLATEAGVRVIPSGDEFILLDPGLHSSKLRRYPALVAPRTTRSKAVHYFVSELDNKGLMFFSIDAQKVTEFPGAPDVESVTPVKGLAIDLAKLRDSKAVTALPWDARFYTKINTIEDLVRAGVYFTKPPSALMIADTLRFFNVIQSMRPNEKVPNFKSGWGRAFRNLLERGMRISVTPQTRNFITVKAEAKRAGISGVGIEVETKYDPGYAAGRAFKRAKTTARYSNPYDLPVPEELRSTLRHLARVTKVVLNSLNIGIDLTVLPVTSKVLGPGGFAAMGIDEVTGNVTIFVNVEKMWDANGKLDKTLVTTNFAHEAGHIIIEAAWNDLPYHIQDMLLTLAERELAANVDATFREARARTWSPVMFMQDQALAGLPHASNVKNFKYFNSIAEVLARGIERFAMGELQAMPRPIRSFLGSQKRRLDELYKAVQKFDKNFMEAPEAIKALAEYFSDPKVPTFMEETAAAKLEAAMRPSGQLALPGVEHPKTGATVNGDLQMAQIFGGGGPPGFWRGFNAAATAADWLSWLAKKSLALRELAHRNNVHLPEMSYLADLGFQFNAFINKQQAKHEKLIKRWYGLGQTKGDRLAKLLFYMSEMKYRTPIEKETKVRRHPTRAEFASALRRFGIRDQETIDVYNQIRQNFIDYLKMSEAAFIERTRQLVARGVIDRDALPGLIEAIVAETQQKLNSPYFPMTRFGDYYNYIKDANGKVVFAENYATAEERDAAAIRLRRSNEFPASLGHEVVSDLKINEELRPFAGYSPRLLEVVRERLNLDDHPELRKQFEVLLYELGPERSFRRHLLEREGIPGYSADARRVYGDYFMHGDRALARMMFEHSMQGQINAMYAASADTTRFPNRRDADRAKRLADFSQGWLNDTMSPAMDWARTKGLMYFWTLAFSPMSAGIQLSQLVFSWGHLTKAYGTRLGTKEVTKALSHSTKNLRTLLANMAIDVDPVKRRAREYAYEVSVLRDGLAAEMANVATGSKMSRYAAHSRVGRGVAWLNYWGGYMIAAADNFGRHVTFDAAYELAGREPTWVDKIIEDFPDYRMLYDRIRADPNLGFTEAQAKQLLAGIHAVNTAYFEVGRWSKPTILKGTLSLPFFLMTFTRGMLYFLATQPGGRRTLGIWWLLAGTAGLPFAEDIDNLIKQVAGLVFGKDFSPLRELRKYLVEVFGEDSKIPGIVMHGLASEGMGLNYLTEPLFGFSLPDMSPSLSISRIIPGLAEINLRSVHRPSELVGEVVQGAGGVPASLAMNFVRFAFSPLGLMDPKRMEMASPRKLRNIIKAGRLAIEGGERTAKGARVPGTEFDWTDPGDALELLMLAVGDAVPPRIRRAQEIQGQQIEAKEFWKGQREALRGKLYQAFNSGDPTDIAEMMEDIQQFDANVRNQGRPELALGSSKQLKQGYLQHLRAKVLTEEGLPTEKMFGPLYKELEQIYGSGSAQVIEKKKVK